MNPLITELAKYAGKMVIETTKTTAENYLKEKQFEMSEALSNRVSSMLNRLPENSNLRFFLPRDNGMWNKNPGDSKWIPDSDYIPKKENPEGKKWEEIAKKNDIDGIQFKDGYPDFGKISKAEVRIDDFTTNRIDNFNQADQKLAKQWSMEEKDGKTWKPSEIAEYRKENNLTWHEKEDMQTLQLLPREIHANIPHEGGIAAKKNELAMT